MCMHVCMYVCTYLQVARYFAKYMQECVCKTTRYLYSRYFIVLMNVYMCVVGCSVQTSKCIGQFESHSNGPSSRTDEYFKDRRSNGLYTYNK